MLSFSMSRILFKSSPAPTRIFLGSKGSQFRGLSETEVAPLKLPHVSSISLYKDNQQIIVAEYENKLSRSMGFIRNDLIKDTLEKLCPMKDNISIVLAVNDRHQAFSAGIATAGLFPIYDRKSDAHHRDVFVEFQIANGDTIDLSELQIIVDSIRYAQKLQDMPCAELNTSTYVLEAQTLAAKLGVSCKVIQGDDLNSQGFGGLYGVGKAATNPPALVILSYKGNPTSDQSVALVGKGIVYDTGGLSIKATAGMCAMKHDMGGSAACLAALESLAKNKAPVNVHALLCLAENAVGPNSVRNDDILTMYSGKTVEVNNTDAEGRLVLADGVAYASRHLNPSLIVDIATLTGAQLITTGVIHAGILTPSEAIEKQCLEAGKKTGDLVFPMLYAKEILASQFESKVADMKNSVKDRMNAQSSCAGHFIESHLESEYSGDYLHIDIAGPSTRKERGTGFGVALLYELVKKY
jgi:probable aminopeptidase NPEPL1